MIVAVEQGRLDCVTARGTDLYVSYATGHPIHPEQYLCPVFNPLHLIAHSCSLLVCVPSFPTVLYNVL